MTRYYYDLHSHSCLSPCADNDNTPNNIAGMAAISGINVIALTDHNSCKNCPAFFAAAKRYGVIPIAGMELTTSEDIHVVCLFEDLDSAMAFDDEISRHRMLIKNRPDIFGEQRILDDNDEIIGYEEHLLSNATSISLDQVPEIVRNYGGICYPAHIDRDANGIVAILGTIPDTPRFSCYEIRDPQKVSEYIERYCLADRRIVISSDAHYLGDIKHAENYFELETDSADPKIVTKELFAYLRNVK